jgi:hypothetical protein
MKDRRKITKSRSTKTFPIKSSKTATTTTHRQAAVDLLLEAGKEE